MLSLLRSWVQSLVEELGTPQAAQCGPKKFLKKGINVVFFSGRKERRKEGRKDEREGGREGKEKNTMSQVVMSLSGC